MILLTVQEKLIAVTLYGKNLSIPESLGLITITRKGLLQSVYTLLADNSVVLKYRIAYQPLPCTKTGL